MNGIELDSRGRWHRPVWSALVGGIVIGVAVGILMFFSLRPPESPISEVSVYTSGLITPFPVVSTVAAIQTPSKEAPLRGAVGQPAPNFTLPTLDGDQVSLADYQGQPVLINFWASWCPPCRLEMPDLVNAYERYKEAGLVILAIDLTFQDTVPDAAAFVEEFGMTFPVLLDYESAVTYEQYRLVGLPMSVFVNREGIVSRIHIGAMTGEQVDEFVAELMEE